MYICDLEDWNMAKRTNDAKEGQPRWTYAAGSIVAIGGLVWGIVSYFIPKPEPQKPTPAAVTPSPSVSVSGSGNVGVGTMSGGQISVGVPAVPSKAGSAP
jgi:hypothetical protein